MKKRLIFIMAFALSLCVHSWACWYDDEEEWWDFYFEIWGDDPYDGYDPFEDDWDDWDEDILDGGDYLEGDGAVIFPDDDDWWNDWDYGWDDDDDWYDDDWWEDIEEDQFYYDSWYQDYVLQENEVSVTHLPVQGADSQKTPYTLQTTDNLILSKDSLNAWDQGCLKQVNNNWCISSTIEYLCLLYGQPTNEGIIIMAINTLGFYDYISVGFYGTVPQLETIFNNWFSLESRSSLTTDLISEGYPIVSNVDMGDGITHSVIIVGYDSSGNYICLDPLIGDFTTYTLSEFKKDYIYIIKGFK